ncbi:MAG: hypothetical protein J7L53_03085 [Deltaproteobacteria bacterium]|nr:hypothetical protein [Deltaproteobacteria bacterium]
MKLAICFDQKRSDCIEIARHMIQAQTLLDFHESSEILALPSGAVGCVHTSDQFSNIDLFRETHSGNWLMISGVPICRDRSLDEKLQNVVEGDYQTAAQFLPDLDGAFAAAFWDNKNQRLLVVTDFLGMQPLYIFRRNSTLLLATEIRGITASGLVNVKMDLAGWGSFISFGHTIGNETMVEAVQQVEPASVLTYDPTNGKLETTTYWKWPDPKPDMTLEDVDTDHLVEMIRQDISAYREHTTHGTILMSGGFDSRLILSLLREEDLCPDVLIVEHKDELWGADGRFATKVARSLGANIKKVSTPRSFYSAETYIDYLVMNEVMTPSLYLFITQMTAYLNTDMKAVWEGLAPGYALVPAHQLPGGFKDYLTKACSFKKSRVWKTAYQIFGHSKAENMYEAFIELLRKETTKYSDDELGVFEFMVRNRMRNRTALNPLKVYTNYVLPFTPGLDKPLWNMIAGMPYEVKSQHKMYLDIFRRHFPGADRIPFVSGSEVYARKSLDGWIALASRRLRQNLAVRAGKMITNKLIRGTYTYWEDSVLVSRVLSRVATDHPDLDPGSISALRKPDLFYNRANRYGRNLIFYWQLWRWVMEGRLTIQNRDILL